MTDALGYRMLFGVVTPSTNTIVQPEYDAMRPVGVTNHVSRMVINDNPIVTDEDFDQCVRDIDNALNTAIDGVLTCSPQHIVLGISAESIWGGGLEPSRRIREQIKARASYKIEVTQAADALPEALKVTGVKRTVAVLTPYAPGSEPHIRSFFEAIGYEPVRFRHLNCRTPRLIAHVPLHELRSEFENIDGQDVEAIIQFGANLPVGGLVGGLEENLKKPVIAVNVATYWHALRRNGITDRVQGFGQLLSRN